MRLLAVLIVLFGYCKGETLLSKGTTDFSACPCSDPDLCKPLDIGPRKEVVGFVTAKDNWKNYNYTYLTTLAIFGELDPEIVCFAHEKKVRVVLAESFELKQIESFDYRDHWISAAIDKVKSSYLDGINIDVEEESKREGSGDTLFMVFLDEISTVFHREIPGCSVSADVAWSPNCIDGRCYDYLSMANYMDFLVVMAYDERSQIHGECVASANSALPTTASGIREFIQLGIHPWKLVLGQPWYGYDYPCTKLDTDDTCHIREVPFRGVNCSDAAGTQVSYYNILQLMASKSAERKWDDTLKSPYFNYMDSNHTSHQVWYDDPESLGLKSSYAHLQGLRGMAYWNIDQLDYTGDAKEDDINVPIWSTLDHYFDDEYWYL